MANTAEKQTDVQLTERLDAHLQELAVEIGERNVFHPRALHRAEEYIIQTWREQGHEVSRQEYEVRGVSSANLEITLAGSREADAIILVGAHYDSVAGSPGGNDNGSGVAALLELGRLFTANHSEKTLRLVAFVNEEPPFYYTGEQGSCLYAARARQRGDDIRLMLSLETIGFYSDVPGSQQYPPLFRYFYPDRADFISLVSNFSSRRSMRRLARAFRACSAFPLEHVATFQSVPGVAWSDHLWFWRQGYPALMVTDTAFYRYPYYHTPLDTADKVDVPRLAQVTSGLHCALTRLANSS